MAKKNKLDLELLIHKYSDIYSDANFRLYDAKEVFYPYYKTKIDYEKVSKRTLHPIIKQLLKSIDEMERFEGKNNIKALWDLSQLDIEILGSILADLETGGLLENKDGILSLTNKASEQLREEKEEVKEKESVFIALDGIFGKIYDISTDSKEIALDKKLDNDSIELKAQKDTIPRIQNLDKDFFENKTLRAHLIESLYDSKKGQISDILDIASPTKYYKRFLTLFYLDDDRTEKYLVINEESEIDSTHTELFSKLLDTSHFNTAKVKGNEENKIRFEEFAKKEELDFTDGHIIDVMEHKSYFLYILRNAKKAVFIQSPWISKNVLDIYESEIKSCLKRGVRVFIKYGLKANNRFDRVGIDEDSLGVCKVLETEFKGLFSLQEDNSHEKYIICDDDFMLLGSFNFLSFGGETRGNEELRKESSSINKNKEAIEKKKKEFKGI